jgi:acylphosphatase
MNAHIFIQGFVQGVGFRQAIKKKANALGLRGWVKNLPDGRVEVLINGGKKEIEEILKFCHKGPFLAEVKEVDISWEKAKDRFEDFKILS